MSQRGRRQSGEDAAPPGQPARAPNAEEQAELDRYFRDTEEGRAALAQFFRDSPEGRACVAQHLTATPEGRAELADHFRTAPEGRARLAEEFRARPGGEAELQSAMTAAIRAGQPTLYEALRADAAVYASLMLRPPQFTTGLVLLRQVLRLTWQHDAFFCLLLYRLRVRLLVRGVPVLPTILHRLCVLLDQIDIGDHVLLEPGVYIPHGKVVIDGVVRVGRGTMLTPWVTLGLTTTIEGPTLGRDVMVGTGAKILGPVVVGDGARVAANAVVLSDVPPATTVAGAPAVVVRVRS